MHDIYQHIAADKQWFFFINSCVFEVCWWYLPKKLLNRSLFNKIINLYKQYKIYILYNK